MAAIGLDYYSDLEEATAAMVQEAPEDRCNPDPDHYARYEELKGLFNHVQTSLESAFTHHRSIWREGDPPSFTLLR
jgi:sugar (pentulose or hexulose) kinase